MSSRSTECRTAPLPVAGGPAESRYQDTPRECVPTAYQRSRIRPNGTVRRRWGRGRHPCNTNGVGHWTLRADTPRAVVQVPPPTPFQGLRTLGNTGDPTGDLVAGRPLVIGLSLPT